MVRTSAVKDTIDAATVPRIWRAALGSPVIDCEMKLPPVARSMPIVTKDRAAPPTAHANGISQRLVRSRWLARNANRFISAPSPPNDEDKPLVDDLLTYLFCKSPDRARIIAELLASGCRPTCWELEADNDLRAPFAVPLSFLRQPIGRRVRDASAGAVS